MTTQDITIYRQDYQPTLDDVIKAWLHAKATHSNSVKTEQAYRERGLDKPLFFAILSTT